MAPSSTPARTYRKHFIPLESNPDVFTELIHKLGVSETLCFQDVLSLDDDLLEFLPRPAYALVLVFPSTEAYEKRMDEASETWSASGCGEDVVFFKQTINNACGLYALLHAVCNGDARKEIGTSGPPIYPDHGTNKPQLRTRSSPGCNTQAPRSQGKTVPWLSSATKSSSKRTPK
jgi:hypothetical protein